jgi:peptidoglycan hydrolase-like protein with peptidoglycan-binding domain
VFRVRSRTAARFALPLAIVVAGIAPAAAQASTQRLGSRTLRQGMAGADVKALQADLTKVGITTAETGFFGTQTARNVRSFESSQGLKANGIATARVISTLKSVVVTDAPSAFAASGSGGGALAIHKQSKTTDPTDIPIVKQNGGSAHLGNRTLRPGMKGHDVRVLQGYLSLVGYATAVDGDYGPATKRNVLAFQTAHDMTANGIVTYSESVVLRQAVATALASGPVGRARINPNGTATAPVGAPAVVKKVVAAANQIIDKPYIYAGGHASWKAPGYDCSGAVSCRRPWRSSLRAMAFPVQVSGSRSTPTPSTCLWWLPGARSTPPTSAVPIFRPAPDRAGARTRPATLPTAGITWCATQLVSNSLRAAVVCGRSRRRTPPGPMRPPLCPGGGRGPEARRPGSGRA